MFSAHLGLDPRSGHNGACADQLGVIRRKGFSLVGGGEVHGQTCVCQVGSVRALWDTRRTLPSATWCQSGLHASPLRREGRGTRTRCVVRCEGGDVCVRMLRLRGVCGCAFDSKDNLNALLSLCPPQAPKFFGVVVGVAGSDRRLIPFGSCT